MAGDLTNTTTTSMSTSVLNFNLPNRTTDSVNEVGETGWTNPNFTKYLSYYKGIPELKAAINALANWTVGKSYESDNLTRKILNRITGMGEDTFENIMWNMLIIKKINGDAYAEIIRNPENGDIINFKPLDPASMTTLFDPKGRIRGYKQVTKTGTNQGERELAVTQVFHLMNDRIADEIHGTSVVEACQWVIDARNEAMADWRRILHRSTIRVIIVPIENTNKITTLRTQYAEAIKNGEVLVVPGKPGDVEVQDFSAPPIEAFMRWIEYLENFFYTAVGVPKVVLGGSSEFTEASSKIALVTFDQAWQKEQTDLEADLWNQCGILIKWNSPASLISETITDEQKNTGQLGFQPNDTQAAKGKTNPLNAMPQGAIQ